LEQQEDKQVSAVSSIIFWKFWT